MTVIRTGGVYAGRTENSGRNEDDWKKFSFFAVFPPGNPERILGKTVRGDEPRATACGGSFARGEIGRNEQCPHEADLRRLSPRIRGGVCNTRPRVAMQR